MAIETITFIGKGKVFLQKKSGGGLFPVANCSKLSFSLSEDKKILKDFMNPGGGNLATVVRIGDTTGNMVLDSFSAENFSLATRGSASALSGGAVTGEAHVVSPGSFIVPKKMFDNTGAVVVKNAAGTTTYDEGNDYLVTDFGIEILTGGTIVAGTVLVDYVSVAENVVETMVSAQEDYRFVFTGMNESRSNKKVVVEAHKVNFSPLKNVDWIGDDFGNLDLNFDILKDESIAAVGKSQYFTYRFVE